MLFTKDKFKIKINYRPIVVVFLCLLFGLISARKIYAGDATYIVLAVISFVSLAVYCCLKRRFVLLILALVVFFAGNGLYFLSYNLFMGKEYNDATISARVNDVDEHETYSIIGIENVVADGDRVSGAYVYVYGTEENDFSVGDVIVFNGSLEHIKMFTLGAFMNGDYRAGNAYTCNISVDDIISKTSGSLKFDEKARAKIKDVLYSNMDEGSADIAFAVLTSDKDDVDSEVKDVYRNAGIIHLLTVSGLHITFLTTIIAWILKKCRVNKYVNFVITFVLLMIYAYICGFAPSVVRAMIMGLMLSMSGMFGRWYDSLTALSLAGIITLLISPLSALDVGFLMSYGCVGAILLLNRPFSSLLRKFLPRKVSNLLSIAIVSQVGLLAFMASFFSSFNVLSFFANMIVVPIFSVLFPLLILLVLLVMIIPAAGPVLKLCEWGFIGIEEIAKFFASTKMQIELRPLDPIFTALLFLTIFSGSYFLMTTAFVKWTIVLILTLVMALYTMVRPEFSYRGSSVSVIGSSFSRTLIIESASGQVGCVGANPTTLKYYLAAEGVDRVDYVFSENANVYLPEGSQVFFQPEGQAGDFKFRIDGDIYIFEFDGVKILFTNGYKSVYNDNAIKRALGEGGFSFVYAENFGEKQDSSTFHASFSGGGDYSFKESGSFKYAFADGRVWRLD